MKRFSKIILLLLLVAVLLTSCSNKGVHMSKHRKSRHCNCPTFAKSDVMAKEVVYDTGGTL
ncbi:MAG: hypothetical protein J5848_06665 [Bacteroidales bacterium]|nr:hypothetical protein [Bacteroidales bacterium]